MNTQAIEAGAVALLKQGISAGELRGASGDWGACGWTIKEEFRSYAQTVIEAARPHIEAELRAQIAAEIRETSDACYAVTSNAVYGFMFKDHMLGIKLALKVVERKP